MALRPGAVSVERSSAGRVCIDPSHVETVEKILVFGRYSWAIPGNERSAVNVMAAMSRRISRGIDPELAEVVKLPSAL
jgi:hypothetical protein